MTYCHACGRRLRCRPTLVAGIPFGPRCARKQGGRPVRRRHTQPDPLPDL